MCIRDSTSTWDVISGTSLGSYGSDWNHYAIVRNGTTWKCYQNGIQTGIDTNITAEPRSDVNTFYIGRRVWSNTTCAKGYIDEFRISKGVARWTSNFTPPARPYSTVNDEFFSDIEKGIVVTDNNDDTNYDVTFTNGVNGLLEDNGQFYYNPNTGTLRVPNLTVQGTTTTVSTVEMQAANAIVFEGATADAFETTLTITDPTVSDKTITLPDATGTVALTSDLYTHPSHPGDDISVDTGVMSSATVISDLDFNVTTDTLGHVTDANGTVSTRTLTLANLGYTGATNANYITDNLSLIHI